MSIAEILKQVAKEAGTNKKIEILGEHKNNELLKRVLYLANSKRVKFYVKQIPNYQPSVVGDTLELGIDRLSDLSNRVVTGDEAKGRLQNILSRLSSEDAYIIERIIEKDCKIGMAATNINKVFKGLIEETPYMGAKSYDEKLARKIFEKGGIGISQIKMDGRYCNAIIRGGDVELESRQGEATIVDGASFLNELEKFSDCVLNGELTMDGVSRYESNGIIASIIDIQSKQWDRGVEETDKKIKIFEAKHGNFLKALESIRFTVWDMITVDEYFDQKSKIDYKQRAYDLDILLTKQKTKMVSMIDAVVVKSYEEAMSHFQEMLAAGHEGTILKSSKGTWKDGKPNWQVKMKLEMDVDLRIIGFNYGTGKNSDVISSLNVESSDGKVVTRPTGINEDMMKYITENQPELMGTIVEVKSCGLSQDSSGNYAMLHPVFKRLRDDKNTCDSLESIMEIEAMAKGLVTK